jgi:hypothetical protein
MKLNVQYEYSTFILLYNNTIEKSIFLYTRLVWTDIEIFSNNTGLLLQVLHKTICIHLYYMICTIYFFTICLTRKNTST